MKSFLKFIGFIDIFNVPTFVVYKEENYVSTKVS